MNNNDNTPFSNLPISKESLPTSETLNFEPLAATYARTMIIEVAGVLSLAFIAGLVINHFVGKFDWLVTQWWLYAAFLALIGLVIILSSMVAKSRGYALREKDMHYKSGILWRNTVSLPYNRIQHVELESNPLERFFHLKTLKFFTAGGGSTDMKIPALTHESAAKVREYVIERAGLQNLSNSSDAK